jgi:hypothetical protein
VNAALFSKQVIRRLTDQLFVFDNIRIKLYSYSLRMTCVCVTHGLITRIWEKAAGIPNRRLQDTFILGRGVMLEEDVLHTPKAARRKRRYFWFPCGYSNQITMVNRRIVLLPTEAENAPVDICDRKVLGSTLLPEKKGSASPMRSWLRRASINLSSSKRPALL